MYAVGCYFKTQLAVAERITRIMMSSIFSWNLGSAGAPALPSSPTGNSAAGSPPLFHTHLEFPSGNERAGMGMGTGQGGGPGGRCVRHTGRCCDAQIIEQKAVKLAGLEAILV